MNRTVHQRKRTRLSRLAVGATLAVMLGGPIAGIAHAAPVATARTATIPTTIATSADRALVGVNFTGYSTECDRVAHVHQNGILDRTDRTTTGATFGRPFLSPSLIAGYCSDANLAHTETLPAGK